MISRMSYTSLITSLMSYDIRNTKLLIILDYKRNEKEYLGAVKANGTSEALADSSSEALNPS